MIRFIQLALIIMIPFSLISSAASRMDEFEFPKGKDIRIVRDIYGVPHVYAREHKYALYGLGYAMAEDRILQIMKTKYLSLGRLSEIELVKYPFWEALSGEVYATATPTATLTPAATDTPTPTSTFTPGPTAKPDNGDPPPIKTKKPPKTKDPNAGD